MDRPLLDRYADWLLSESSEMPLGGGEVELNLPYLDRHNDHLVVYVVAESGGRRITDDGQIVRDLEQCGRSFRPGTKRRRAAEKIVRGLGLDEGDFAGKRISAMSRDDDDFPMKLNHVLLAMLAIDGLGLGP